MKTVKRASQMLGATYLKSFVMFGTIYSPSFLYSVALAHALRIVLSFQANAHPPPPLSSLGSPFSLISVDRRVDVCYCGACDS